MVSVVDRKRKISNNVAGSESDSDSDAELEQLIKQEEGISDNEDDVNDSESESADDDEDELDSDPEYITDAISNIRIRSLSNSTNNSEDNLPSLKEGEVLSEFADGTTRIIRPEIDPVYDSDDSDKEEANTIGNIPLSLYDEMPHIGYDINGRRIMRPAKGSALDQLLESIDLPEGWTGLLDKNTGSSLNLTSEELELIKKIQKNENPDESVDPYEPTIEWFTSQKEIMPLTAVPEPKRRFVPSKHEAKRIMKIVRAIRDGRIIPPEQLKKQKEEDEEKLNYDLWEDAPDTHEDHIMTLRAPKMAPPTNDESYNPPEEYLLTEEEQKEWEKLDPMDREKNYIPKRFGALRKVPGYKESVRERFERSLDLYLAPRVRHNKLNIDPDSLIPDLPSPKDLRPFPIRCSVVYKGHKGKIRSISIDPLGLWLATGSDDGSVIVWEILTGRQVWKTQLVDVEENNNDDHIEAVEWNPDSECGILAVTVGENIYLTVPPIFGFDIENNGYLKIEQGYGYEKNGNVAATKNIEVSDSEEESEEEGSDEEEEKPKNHKKQPANAEKKKIVSKWLKPTAKQQAQGISLIIQCRKTIKKLSWHRKGDYFVTTSPNSGNVSILIHQVSKHLSQSPFKKSKGIMMDAKFHPFKPQLFVASQRYIKIYDLSQQVLVKKLLPGARWINSFDIHARGDNVVVSSFDKKVLWHDLDLSSTPYKILRYHEKAVRSIQFHKGGLPLWASSSDDGTIHVFHGMVYDDLMTNPLLVPLKKLTGHKIINNLGVLDVVWHPKEAWLFSSGADGCARLWTT